MRADRLLSIIMLLQAHGRMTAQDLAARLEVSERTIYRDLEALGSAGIPIYTERGPGGGIELLDGYQTRLTGLNEGEVLALALLLKAASPAQISALGLRKALDDALLKLQAALPPTSRASAERIQQRIHVDDCSAPEVALPDASCLRTIQQALLQEQRLSLTYHDEREGWRPLRVEPYGLVTRAGNWYLAAAICADRQFCRILRVEHIRSAEMLPERFARPDEFDLAVYWNEYCAQVAYMKQTARSKAARQPTAFLPQDIVSIVSAWEGHTVNDDDGAEPGQKIIPLRQHREKSSQAKKKTLYKKKIASARRKKSEFSLDKKEVAPMHEEPPVRLRKKTDSSTLAGARGRAKKKKKFAGPVQRLYRVPSPLALRSIAFMLSTCEVPSRAYRLACS